MKLNTNKFNEKVKSLLQKVRLRYLADKDIRRFSRNASFSIYDASFDQLSARIMYNVHAIEKGMSHEENFRPGFGKKALSALNDSLVIYEGKKYKKDQYPYMQGRAIIYKYIKMHEALNENLDFLKNLISAEFLVEEDIQTFVGTKVICKSDKIGNKNKNFFELSQNRYSIREFSGEKIDKHKVLSAIKMAEKTPSVCNRQGWKIYLVCDKRKIEKLLELQRGFKGYGNLPEIVLAIGVSNATFLSPVERNEAFIDGGLFSMSVLYGLEYEGVAAVPLNAMMNSKDENDIRMLIELPDAVQIVMFIAIGDMKTTTVVPVSSRRSAEEFVTII